MCQLCKVEKEGEEIKKPIPGFQRKISKVEEEAKAAGKERYEMFQPHNQHFIQCYSMCR